jgi:hypothetical protein
MFVDIWSKALNAITVDFVCSLEMGMVWKKGYWEIRETPYFFLPYLWILIHTGAVATILQP